MHLPSAPGISVVGVSFIDTEVGLSHAFLFQDGVMHDLGTLGEMISSASDINNAGDIVGKVASYTTVNEHIVWTHRAMVYQGGQMRDLNSLVTLSDGASAGFVRLEYANGINNLGVIIGGGLWTDGQGNTSDRSFIATPAAIPEPASVALYLSGAVFGILLWRRRFGRK